jgi:hypothetical protein
MPHDEDLPDFHPMTVLRDWNTVAQGAAFRIGDAVTGVACFGGTGSGKTSGPARHLAHAYLENDFGGLVLCAKPEERQQWEEWAAATGRSRDLCIVNAKGDYRFNFLDWEASRPSSGGGLTINIVALLDEIAGAIAGAAAKAADSGGDNKFFDDALHHMNTNLVDLPLFARLPVSLPLMRAIVNTAPQSLAEAESDKWKNGGGQCAAILREADAATAGGNPDARADFEECKAYWTQEFPNLSEKTRSIITLSFSMLVRPFITRPLRRLFSSDTNITPEACFAGRIIIVDLPIQQYRLAGRVAALAWKYCFQISVLRRGAPPPGEYHLPVFLWWDEGQNFLTKFDTEWHAVARSAGGCSVMLVQTREALRSVLGNNDAVDALLANLQCKFFCQNSSTDTNEFASRLLGERYVEITTSTGNIQTRPGGAGTAGTSVSEQKRRYVEPARFTTLKRGGARNNYVVQAIVYNGGEEFLIPDRTTGEVENYPCALFKFNQRE